MASVPDVHAPERRTDEIAGEGAARRPEVIVPTRGVVYIHSCPPAVCPHAEWALSGVLGSRVSVSWTDQPGDPGQLRAECAWSGRPGTGAQLAAALRTWSMLRFEVTEDPSLGYDGERIAHVPGRGIHRVAVGANGDLMVGEQQLREVLAKATNLDTMRHAVHRLLGTGVDADLEPYRLAGDGAPVTWMHQVG